MAGAIGNFGSVRMEMAFDKRKISLLQKDLLDMGAILEMDQTGE